MKLHPRFIEEINSYQSVEFDGLEEVLISTTPSISVRANTIKNIETPSNANQVKWCDYGWYLPKRIPFTFDPAMHQGLYYVQDASSMIISHIVKFLSQERKDPLRYLDACAAPGGKTTAAIDSLPSNSLVVANEYMSSRASVLSENVTKWGFPMVVSQGDTSRFKKIINFFDIIAADVPCSGEGMFRKDSEAVTQWSPALVEECVARQQEIVSNLWQSLRPGGYMIYSTCTFNRHENEEMIDFLIKELGAISIKIEMPDSWNIVRGIDTNHHCYRFMPNKIAGEGLFIAVVQKIGGNEADVRCLKSAKNQKKNNNKAISNIDAIKSWILDDLDFEFILENDNVIAFPIRWKNELSILKSHLNVICYGISVAMTKGKDFIPTQSLAMSIMLNKSAFPNIEVGYQMAISYLRREAIILDDAPRGYILLNYKGKPLGFVKNLGNRANNLYPQEWRILSSHIPEEMPQVI